MNDIKNIIKYSKGLRLLYVEDNIEARESTIAIFEQFFNEIIIADDGEDGLDKFKSNKVDIIITDINMPRITGLEMISFIRELDKNIPILILSAYNEADYFMDSIKLGVEGYLLKPIEAKQFTEVLSKIILKVKLTIEARKSSYMLQQYKEITDKSSMISLLDKDKNITFVNTSFCDTLLYDESKFIGKNFDSVFHYKKPLDVVDIWETKHLWQGVVESISENNVIHYLKTTIKPMLRESNQQHILEYIVLQDDITAIMNPKKQLNDVLKNYKEPVVIYLMLDEFQISEEFYGNEVLEDIQDIVLKYLEDNLPKKYSFEKVYRLGHGEFVLACERSTLDINENMFIDNLKKFQEMIKKGKVDFGNITYDMSVLMSLAYEGDKVLESARFGIVKLLKSKQNFIISNNFAQIEREEAESNLSVLSTVKHAINNLKIVSYFQAIINNKTGEIDKYESLVRLIDENGEVKSPFFFLDISKKGSYYSQITDIVLQNSFEALNLTDKDITINLSALDIERDDTRESIFKLLEKYKDETSRIVFELLEDEKIKNFDVMKTFICDVKKLDVKIAIDDFGSGYSNFERLLDYQPDILKIDGGLIKNIVTDKYSLDIVETIIDFAKKQNILTIAEFVENEDIFKIIKKLDIDYSQGYYFDKPSPL